MFHEFAVGASWVITRRIVPDAYAASLLRWVVAIPLTFILAYIIRITFEARVLSLKKRFTAPLESPQSEKIAVASHA